MRSSLTRMARVLALAAAVAMIALPPAPANSKGNLATLEGELRATETAFAKTMADRDAAAFASFISEEAIFIGRSELRGKKTVTGAWARFFEGDRAPFSWQPETAVVLESGKLGLTSGPVFDPDGKRIGTFNSVWRRERNGEWKIVFDKGCPPCETP